MGANRINPSDLNKSDVFVGSYSEPNASRPSNDSFDNESYNIVTEPANGGTTIIAGSVNHEGKTVLPTVGWLVCVEGKIKGTDFRLHAGWNYIGRDVKNDACIPDEKIDRQGMAGIMYEPRGKCFYISPMTGCKNITYLNDKPVLGGGAILNAYDTITVGDSKLMFIPFCGEKFTWEG